MREGWQPAPPGYEPVREWGLQFPIRRGVLPNPWIVIGQCRKADGSYEIKAHYDGDDPDHEFLGASAWAGIPTDWRLPPAATLAQWYNARHYRAMRLRFKRAMTYTGDMDAIMTREGTACLALDAVRGGATKMPKYLAIWLEIHADCTTSG